MKKVDIDNCKNKGVLYKQVKLAPFHPDWRGVCTLNGKVVNLQGFNRKNEADETHIIFKFMQ